MNCETTPGLLHLGIEWVRYRNDNEREGSWIKLALKMIPCQVVLVAELMLVAVVHKRPG